MGADASTEKKRGSRSKNRRRRARLAAPLQSLAVALLLVVSFVAPLWVGGVHRGTIGFSLGTCTLALLCGLWALRSRGHSRMAISLAGAVGLAAIGLTLLQLLPLPAALIAQLSPAAVDLREYVLAAAGQAGGQAAPITLDVPSTWGAVGRIAAIWMAFLAAVAASRRRKQARKLLWALPILGALLVALGLVHWIVGFNSWFGYGASAFRIRGFFSAFVNANHLAGCLNLCCLVGLGLMMNERAWPRFVGLGALSALSGVGVLLTHSRGGVIALAVGLAALFLMNMLGREGGTEQGDEDFDEKRPITRISRAAVLQIAALAMIVGAVLVDQDALVAEFEKGETVQLFGDANVRVPLGGRKIEVWRQSLPLLSDYWLTGVGRDAFWVAYTRYKQTPENRTITHPENVVVQLIAERGVIAGGLFLLFGLWLLWLIAHRCRRIGSARFGVAAGMLALWLHNLADFSLEILGVALPLAVVVGAVVGYELASSKNKGAWSLRVPLPLVLAAVLLTAGAGAYGLLRAEEDDPRHHVTAMDQATPQGRAAVQQALADAVAAHPADYFIPFRGARALVAIDDKAAVRAALPWLNRAMYLNPTAYVPHLDAARLLIRLGYRRQALGEYALALKYHWHRRVDIFEEIVRAYPAPEDWSRAVPRHLVGRRFLLERLLQRGKLKEADALLRDLETEVLDAELAWVLASRAEVQGRRGKHDRAERLAQRAVETFPDEVQGYRSLATAQAALGRKSAALATLQRGASRRADCGDIQVELARRCLEAHDELCIDTALDRALIVSYQDRAARSGCADRLRGTRLRAEVYFLRARRHAARDELRPAIQDLRRCLELKPDHEVALGEMVRLRARAGDLQGALRSYRNALVLRPQIERELGELAGRLEAQLAGIASRREGDVLPQ